jgi:hypothetical protein
MLSSDFLSNFKRTTELMWSKQEINPVAYGFQFQRGTRWNPGLTEEKIAEYEKAIAIEFPTDFKVFLRVMNGTDMPTLNVYGYCGEPFRESVGVYSYPRDLNHVQRCLEAISEDRAQLMLTMADQGFNLPQEASLMPIYGHRYLMCGVSIECGTVLSIADPGDAIVYGNSLQEYLEKEFL